MNVIATDKPAKILANCARQSGKELHVDTPVPTPTGWTTMGDLNAGDTVFDEQGEPTKVTYCSEIRMHPTYRVVFSDGSEIIANGEHLWTTLDAATRSAVSRSVKDVPVYWPFWKSHGARGHANKNHPQQKHAKTLTTEEIRATIRYGARQDTNHAIPTTQPLKLPEAELPIDPYVLGVWLGDGTSADGSITCVEEEIIGSIRAREYVVRKQNTRSDRAQGWGILELHPKLRASNLTNNKHIPSIYLRASTEQRLALLRGLMDTDGSASSGARSMCEFSVTSKPLADGTMELLHSLGILARIKESHAKLNGRVTGLRYRITFTPWFNPFSLKRKAARVNLNPARLRKGLSKLRFITDILSNGVHNVRCIAVDSPSGLYLAGKSMIPTHNTQTAAICSVYHAITGSNRTVVIISPSMRQSQYMFRRIMQVYRAALRPVRAVSETALQLRLENNSWIVGLPSSEETIRGLTASLLWVEEASRCSDSLISAALPFVATIPNAKLCMMSTPAGQRGMWYNEWSKGVGYKKILVNADQCPRISRNFLDSQLEMMGSRWYQQEYYNSFESNEASLFRHEVIQKCIRDDLETLDDVLDAALELDDAEQEEDGINIDDIGLD
jgi:replicative DNA helicase